MNELALFAGGGGGILAGHMLGWRTVAAGTPESHAQDRSSEKLSLDDLIARVKRRDDELAQRERPCLDVKVDTWICWHMLKRVELVVVRLSADAHPPLLNHESPAATGCRKVLDRLAAVRAELLLLGLLEHDAHTQPVADLSVALPSEARDGIRVQVPGGVELQRVIAVLHRHALEDVECPGAEWPAPLLLDGGLGLGSQGDLTDPLLAQAEHLTDASDRLSLSPHLHDLGDEVRELGVLLFRGCHGLSS